MKTGKMRTLIIYQSASGHVFEAFHSFIKSIEEEGADAKVILAQDFEPEMIEEYDSLVIGIHIWGGYTDETPLAFPVIKAIKSLAKDALKDKLCGCIVVHAKYGEKVMLKYLKTLLETRGCRRFEHTIITNAEELGDNKSVGQSDEELLCDFGKELMLLQFSKV